MAKASKKNGSREDCIEFTMSAIALDTIKALEVLFFHLGSGKDRSFHTVALCNTRIVSDGPIGPWSFISWLLCGH